MRKRQAAIALALLSAVSSLCLKGMKRWASISRRGRNENRNVSRTLDVRDKLCYSDSIYI